MDLLQAIKTWNLKKRTRSHDGSSPRPLHDNMGDASLGSNIGSHGTQTDYDTLTAVSTSTSKEGFTISSATKSAPAPKTPLCNYSSRPSFLTARILQEDDLLPVVSRSKVGAVVDVVGANSSSSVVVVVGAANANVGTAHVDANVGTAHVDASREENPSHKEKGKEQLALQRTTQRIKEFTASTFNSKSNTHSTSERRSKGPEGNDIENAKDATKESLPCLLPRQEKILECEQALEILRQTAAELGIPEGEELGAVLVTVRKLVRVITQHVPRLEKFVEQVCDTVMHPKDVDGNFMHDDGNVESGFKNDGNRRQKKLSKKRCGKNMQERKECMDAALDILKTRWNTNVLPVESLDEQGEKCTVLNPWNVNENNHGTKHGNNLHAHVDKNVDGVEHVVFHYQDYQSYGSFTTQVKERLSKHHQKTFSNRVKENVSQIGTSTEGLVLTDAEALEEINRLIEFEESYRHKINGLLMNRDMDHDEGVDSCLSLQSLNDTNPSQNDTVLQYLLNANTTTLRRFVLHFAYLFSVRQDGILEKMNELYVFSHEATNLINDIKKHLDLPLDCSIHSVARQVVAAIQKNRI